MTKRTTDNFLYFYYVMMNKWKGLALETISMSKVEEKSSREQPSMKMLKDGANELGIEIEELVDGAYEFKRGNVIRRIKGPLFDLENAFTRWLCANKFATFEILKKYGFQQLPYYQRYSLITIEEARKDFLMRERAVVIKPCSRTSGGLGVTVNIQSIKNLNRAIFNSLRHDSNYLMEDFIEGDNFRILLFKDRMLDALQRIPANVKGDGKNNIKNLIRVENDRRVRDKSSVHLHPIAIDNEVRQTLLNQKMSLNYVPIKDEMVYVKAACNLHAGGEARDVTSIVHPDIIRDCKSIMKIMNITVGGIDIIAKDINKPLAETGGVINEVNTGAGLYPHKQTAVVNILNLMFEEKLTYSR